MLLSIIWILPFLISAGNATATNCTAFTNDQLAGSTFRYYRFFDFRNVNNPSNSTLSAEMPQNSKTISDDSWTNYWYIRDYPRKSSGPPIIPVSFTPKRVTITNSTDESSRYSTYLTLSTARLDEDTQEGGEITFDEYNVSYASIRVLGRVHGTPGACGAVFTYLNDTEESDIEMFTKDPHNYVHYSNQPSSTGPPNWTPIPGATVNVSMPKNWQWTQWHVHQLDWTPGHTAFFIDGIQTNTTTLQVPTPKPPSGIYLDIWGANSSWVGQMPIGGQAWFDVQWVELLFNASTEPPSVPTNLKLCTVSSAAWGLRSIGTNGRTFTIWLSLAVLIVGY